MRSVKLSLILPIHQQETIIEQVLVSIIDTLESTACSFEVLLIENGSTDSTLSILKKLAKHDSRLRVYSAPKGYGSAVIAGLNKARGKWVSYMPSDGQIDLAILPPLLTLMKEGRYDMVKIRRTTRESWIRAIRSKIFYILSTFVFGTLPVSDINGSPRIFKQSQVKRLKLFYKDSFIDLEFTLKAKFLHWKIKEVPMQTLPRAGGKSTVSIATVIEFLRNIANYRLNSQFGDWVKEMNFLPRR